MASVWYKKYFLILRSTKNVFRFFFKQKGKLSQKFSANVCIMFVININNNCMAFNKKTTKLLFSILSNLWMNF